MNIGDINKLVAIVSKLPYIKECEYRPNNSDIYILLDCDEFVHKLTAFLVALGINESKVMWNDCEDYTNEGSIDLT